MAPKRDNERFTVSNLDTLFVQIVDGAKCPEDLFGLVFDQDRLDATYKQLVRSVHPDLVPAHEKDKATQIFQRLSELKRQAEYKHAQGTYGDRTASVEAKPAVAPTVIETKKRKYAITTRVAIGDIADLYRASFMHGADERVVVMKVASHPGDNDLMENESKVLTKLGALTLDDHMRPFMRFIPALDDTFALQDGKTKRRVNVLPDLGDYYSLLEVYREKDAIDFRDMVWMYKRTLEALGFLHRQGVVHGAITPAHVLVHPVNHGAKLIDWCYATEPGGTVKAGSKTWRALYAPEILEKKPVSAATDIYMATKCAVFLVGGNIETNRMSAKVPAEVQRFLTGCLMAAPSRRPDDAWKVRDEFGELLQRLVGKPTYRRLEMAARGA